MRWRGNAVDAYLQQRACHVRAQLRVPKFVNLPDEIGSEFEGTAPVRGEKICEFSAQYATTISAFSRAIGKKSCSNSFPRTTPEQWREIAR
jgi:hypothetical protein